jgi:hypothetical protein
MEKIGGDTNESAICAVVVYFVCPNAGKCGYELANGRRAWKTMVATYMKVLSGL